MPWQTAQVACAFALPAAASAAAGTTDEAMAAQEKAATIAMFRTGIVAVGPLLVGNPVDCTREIVGHEQGSVRQLRDVDRPPEIFAGVRQPALRKGRRFPDRAVLVHRGEHHACTTASVRFQEPCWAENTPPRYSSGN